MICIMKNVIMNEKNNKSIKEEVTYYEKTQ